jgi:signal transduction histidine kinase
MIKFIKSRFEENPFLADLFYALLFGVLSFLFSAIKFQIPGVENVAFSDFREIPLLLSVLYIKRPVFLIVVCLLTSLETPEGGSYATTFIMHFAGIVTAWFVFNKIILFTKATLGKGLIWMIFTIFYYAFILIPLMLLIDYLADITHEMNFFSTYTAVMSSLRFEIMVSSFVTSLYLMQHEITQALILTRQNLEHIVNSRTKELTKANRRLRTMNDELVLKSEEIKSMNNNLDNLVKIRSNKINKQLNLLVRYSSMNSHEVRAPLARILGLIEIVKLGNGLSEKDHIVEKLCESAEELDGVVKSMNRLLEKEIDSEETE